MTSGFIRVGIHSERAGRISLVSKVSVLGKSFDDRAQSISHVR